MALILFFTFSGKFYISFFTGNSGGVAFAYSVHLEVLSAGGEVALAFLILVVVYVLIGFEVGVGRCEGRWGVEFVCL